MKTAFTLCMSVASLGLGACSAKTDSDGPATPTATSTTTTPPPRPPAPPGVLVPDIDDPVAACAVPVTAGPEYMRRLTNNEYLRSVTDLLMLTPADLSAVNLVIEGFGNDIAGLPITNVHLERYDVSAANLAELSLSTPERRQKLIDCELAQSESCLTRLIETLGKRAFRRPLAPNRVQELLTVARAAQAEPDPYAGAKLAIEAILVSPRFIYRVESKSPEVPLAAPSGTKPAPAGARVVDGYELATRLSYLLWGTTPDANLMGAAEAGQLGTQQGLETTARGMLQDPRARTGIGEFITGWLHLYDVDTVPRSATTYPEFTDPLRASMRAETETFVNDFVWAPEPQNVFGMLTAPYTYADANLASLYGISAPAGGLARVDFSPPEARSGLFGQAALLTLPVVGSETTAPILRGKFVREQFLCTPPPPPPGNVPPAPTDPNLSVRERLAQHSASPACSPCHQLLDPIGLGLEQYDLIGRYRATGIKGEALTGDGKVVDGDRSAPFQGPKGLGEIVAGSSDTASCVVHHLYGYTYGREPGTVDNCSQKNAVAAFQKGGYNFQSLLLALVKAEEFRTVSTTGAAP
ncbi:MAG: DUF1592 domain-containing protein [Polyangiaceae bacterium]|nr:DUF1592 domain-containing protein [Polyangiaceae bacterium]